MAIRVYLRDINRSCSLNLACCDLVASTPDQFIPSFVSPRVDLDWGKRIVYDLCSCLCSAMPLRDIENSD